MAAIAADRSLLFGLLALQNGLIDHVQLVAAFQAWTRDKARPLAEHLVARGDLDAEQRALLEGLVAQHLKKHGGDVEQSLAAVPAGRSIRDGLADLGDPDVDATLGQVGVAHPPTHPDDDDPDRTASLSVGPPTSGGQRFRILRPHALGGLGAVFVALDSELNREVALKQILDRHADDPVSRQRFLVEAEITGGLEHPGIVPVYGVGTSDGGRPYYAMRFISGDSLKEVIARFHGAGRDLTGGGRQAADRASSGDTVRRATGGSRPTLATRTLELNKLLRRFLGVCNAIDYAHSRGVLHRDLKPGNIIIGKHGETIVVDWGLAKATGRSDPTRGEHTLVPSSVGGSAVETLPGSAVGTPAYMSPEQARGDLDTLGPHSDVYSLGATLYCLLTGKAPFEGNDVGAILRAVQEGRFAPPRRVDPSIPRSLEAVCVKAMALKPADRYGSAMALANDLERWMADEPVQARPEPVVERSRRWMRRHRTLVTTTSAVLLVSALGLVAYATQRLAAARGRVESLATADIRAVPRILEELGKDRALVRQSLRALADAEPGSLGRLAATLALLPDEPDRADELVARLLQDEGDVPPEQLLVIRQTLAGQGLLVGQANRLIDMLEDLDGSLTDSQLRALGLLALIEPASARWTRPLAPRAGVSAPPEERASESLAGLIAAKLAEENPLRLDAWRQVFQPVARSLTEPLRAIYVGTKPQARDRAFTLLFEFAMQPDNPRRPEDLAALLAEAEPDRFERILARLTADTDKGRAIATLEPLLEPVSHFDNALAERQGRIATALVRLEAPARVWPLFVFRNDPSVRTELIHQFGRYGVDPGLVIARLRTEGDLSARRALVLCLGGYPKEALAEPERRTLETELLKWYRTAPDPGLHGAVDWLLRRCWGLGERLDGNDRELASRDVPADRGWYVNGEGQTYAIVRGPVSFMMGWNPGIPDDPVTIPTPDVHSRILENARWHRRKIPRSFAIATREVTVAGYERFLDTAPDGVVDHREHHHFRFYFPTPDCAIGDIDWYAAASYCNWLSAREGIPKDQWCYPEKIGPGMELPKDHLERTGYRLPTEGEWEYACRSGTVTLRPYGGSNERLAEYAWFESNSGGVAHPTGMLKPNDLGLFDGLGNLNEWCCDPAVPDPTVPYPVPVGDAPLIDGLEVAAFSDDVVRRYRGYWFRTPAPTVNPASRPADWPSKALSHTGFRPVRTLPPGPPSPP